jgi:hypothetical protein
MKRQIICSEDARKYPLHKYDGEWSKRIYGQAKGNYICDLCGKDIKSGEGCCAESMGLGEAVPDTFWEKDYIEVKK